MIREKSVVKIKGKDAVGIIKKIYPNTLNAEVLILKSSGTPKELDMEVLPVGFLELSTVTIDISNVGGVELSFPIQESDQHLTAEEWEEAISGGSFHSEEQESNNRSINKEIIAKIRNGNS